VKIIGLVGALVLVILAVVVAVDLASGPTPQKGQCLLRRQLLLPDRCVNSCASPFDCTVATRPYLVFWTQAATCLDGVICP
jgi:hypothetical protein